MSRTEAFLRARDFLLRHREDYDKAYSDFRWPCLTDFNWALDWFDVLAAGNKRPALRIFGDGGGEVSVSYAELSERSSRMAGYLRRRGVARGDAVLVMLPATLALWEVMLAAIKLGVTILPTSGQLTAADLADRIARAGVRHVVTTAAEAEKLSGLPGPFTRFVAGDAPAGWTSLDEALSMPATFVPDGVTRAGDPLLAYFTSGTTARPKLVVHTHGSYPAGQLAMMYWLGLREGDVHQNVSSPGWAKHAGSSFFAPFNAGATVLADASPRFSEERLLDVLSRGGVGTLCAPPTVWRRLITRDLGPRPAALHDLASAGEPLNPEVIERVRAAWGLPIRDGFGQTETTALAGNTPGQPVRPGSMGRPLPGYDLSVIDAGGREGDEGELVVRLTPGPLGIMAGYIDDPERTAAVMAGGLYRTGDQVTRDEMGYIHHVGRGDDVFKSSDYRISPFELESVLMEHPAVAEAAVVPAPDALRLAVPKAFIVLAPGHAPGAGLAREILQYARDNLAPYKRVRRIEFADLPRTVTGKIRRAELRAREMDRAARGERGADEHRVEDFER